MRSSFRAASTKVAVCSRISVRTFAFAVFSFSASAGILLGLVISLSGFCGPAKGRQLLNGRLDASESGQRDSRLAFAA